MMTKTMNVVMARTMTTMTVVLAIVGSASCLSLQQRALQQQLRAQRPTAPTAPLRVACAHDQVERAWPAGVAPSTVRVIVTGWSDPDVSYWLLSEGNDYNDDGADLNDAPRGVAMLSEASPRGPQLLRVDGQGVASRSLPTTSELLLPSLSWTPCLQGDGTGDGTAMCVAAAYVDREHTTVLLLPEADFSAEWSGVQLDIRRPQRIAADPAATQFVAQLEDGTWWSEGGDIRSMAGGELLRRGPAVLHTEFIPSEGPTQEPTHALMLHDTQNPDSHQNLVSQATAIIDLNWTRAGPSWREAVTSSEPPLWVSHSYHCDG